MRAQSESLELPLSLSESLECVLSASPAPTPAPFWTVATLGARPFAFPPAPGEVAASNILIRCSSKRIFSASAASSMLFRLRPPVPAWFRPVLKGLALVEATPGVVGGACFGFITAFHNARKTADGNASISISISSVFCANDQCIRSMEILRTHVANVRDAVVDDLNDLVERRAFEILDRLAQFLLFLERKLCICVERPTLHPVSGLFTT